MIPTTIKQIIPFAAGWTFAYMSQSLQEKDGQLVKGELCVRTTPIIGQAIITNEFPDGELEDSLQFVIVDFADNRPQTLREFERDIDANENTYPMGLLEPGETATISDQDRRQFEEHQLRVTEECRLARAAARKGKAA